MPKHARRRLTGAAIATGAAGSLALALSMGASLSGYVATITNSTNTAASTAIAVQETGPGVGGATFTCNSYDASASCGTINKYGGTTTPLQPGQSQTTTVNFKNTGTTTISNGTLKGGACTALATTATGASTPTTGSGSAGNLCSVMTVTIYRGSDATAPQVFTGSLNAFETAAASTLPALAIGATQPYTFVVALPSTAGNAVQGQSVSQPMTWTFNQ